MVEGQNGNVFLKEPLVRHLESCMGRTLGELDVNNVFRRTVCNPKITGIAGDVVEQSILFLKPNSNQRPDIVVEGESYEVKTTGLRDSKTECGLLEAKEPMSITAVSPNVIVKEEYFNSAFWHKVEHLLLFYYKYDSATTVPAAEYARFPMLNYHFHEYSDFSAEDQQALENDWKRVRDFIRWLQTNYPDYESQYGRISYDLRKTLLLLDTAPKWPANPRFRFKRTFVTSIYRNLSRKKKRLEKLPDQYSDYKDLDDKCNAIRGQFKGMTVGELCQRFHIEVAEELKSIVEPIIIKMFGGTAKKMRNVEFFNKVGIWGKGFVITRSGKRTEDAKFFTIRFEEFHDDAMTFENSQFYEFFSNTRVLVAVFEEPSNEAPLRENRFVGFKTIVFDDDFIYNEVKPVWDRTISLIRNHALVDVPRIGKDGKQIRNKNGELSSAPNFPKSSEGVVFFRGTGMDSKDKRECVNGIRMYCQQLWIRGDYLAKLVRDAF